MLPLIKVRVKYFKSRQFCCCSFTYIFFLVTYTLLMILATIYQENLPKKIYNNTILYDVNLLNIDNYTKLQTYLEKTSLIVNDKDIGEKLKIFIENKTHVNAELNNNTMQSQIKLDYNKDKDSYKFLYLIKDKNLGEQNYPFKNSLLSAREAENLFISINPNNLKEYYKNNSEQIQNFILYQSLLSNFMISQKSNITQKKNVKFKFGFNSYPPSVEIRNNFYLEFTIVYLNIGLIFGQFIFVFQLFSERMLKIDVILNRQGISKTSNFLSWIAIFFIINSFIYIISCIGLSLILKFSLWFLFSYLLLIMIDSFLVSYIIATSFKIKNGIYIIYAIISIFPFIIAYFLYFKDLFPISKFILCIFPNINLIVVLPQTNGYLINFNIICFMKVILII